MDEEDFEEIEREDEAIRREAEVEEMEEEE